MRQRSSRPPGCQLRENSSARNCRAIWSSTALTMPVSSRSTKACATSTYSDTPARHVPAMFELVSAGAQHRAQDRVDPLQRPALRQRLVDQGIELGLVAHDAGDDIAEEGGFGRQIFLTLDLAAQPVAFELGEDVVDAGASDIHLVKRLHGGEPRGTAPVRLPLRRLAVWPHVRPLVRPLGLSLFRVSHVL